MEVRYSRQCCCGCSLQTGVVLMAVWMSLSRLFYFARNYESTEELMRAFFTWVSSAMGIYGARRLQLRPLGWFSVSRLVEAIWIGVDMIRSLVNVKELCEEEIKTNKNNDWYDVAACESYQTVFILFTQSLALLIQVYFFWVVVSFQHQVKTGGSKHWLKMQSSSFLSLTHTPVTRAQGRFDRETQSPSPGSPRNQQVPQQERPTRVYALVIDPSGQPMGLVSSSMEPGSDIEQGFLPTSCMENNTSMDESDDASSDPVSPRRTSQIPSSPSSPSSSSSPAPLRSTEPTQTSQVTSADSEAAVESGGQTSLVQAQVSSAAQSSAENDRERSGSNTSISIAIVPSEQDQQQRTN